MRSQASGDTYTHMNNTSSEIAGSGPEATSVKRLALVTGASRGIGRAISVELVRAGIEVHGCGRDQSALDETAALCDSPGSFHSHSVDVRSITEMESVISELPRLDICVNNAAILRVGSLVETNTADFEEMLAINVLGAFGVMRAAARRMLADGGGQIIDIASDLAIDPGPGAAAYTATKHALAGLSKTLAVEVLDGNVLVTTVYPGAADTDIHDAHSFPRDGFMSPEEVARATVAAVLACDSTVRIKELHLQPVRAIK